MTASFLLSFVPASRFGFLLFFCYLKEFRQELESSKPEITAGLGYGSLLLEDDVIDDDSKASIRQEIKLVEEHVLRLEQAFGIENSR